MLLRISFFAALGGFLFGYDLGLIGGALLGFKTELGITKTFSLEAIVGALKFGSFFGTFLGGALMLRYGRRPAIAATAVTGLIGPLLMASATGAAGLVAGRVISGLGIGVSAIVVPAYLAELAPAAQRGAVVQVYEIMLTLGMLSSTIVDAALQHVSHGWRWMVGIPALPGAAIGLALLILPESPRWLVMQGKLDEALRTLQRTLGGSGMGLLSQRQTVRPEKVLADAEDELLLLWSSVEKDMHAVKDQRTALLTAMQAGWKPVSVSGTEPLLASQRSINENGQAASQNNSSEQHGSVQAMISVSQNAQRDDIGHSQLLGSYNTLPDSGNGDAVASDGLQFGVVAGYSNQNEQKAQYNTPSHMFTLDPDVDEGLISHDNGPQQQKPSHSIQPEYQNQQGINQLGGNNIEAGYSHQHSSSSPDQATRQGIGGPPLPGKERHFLATLGAMLLDIVAVLRGPEGHACIVACCLAIFNQATASTAIINYAPVLLQRLGSLSAGGAVRYTIAIAVTKVIGVAIGMFTVDVWGRRPLLIWGAVGCCVSMALATAATAFSSTIGLLACMCAFIFAFSISWAGVYWVVVSELFSMAAKSPASSLATSLLFLSGSVTNVVFLAVVDVMSAYAFLVFAGVAAASAAYVWHQLPETKGRTLAAVQELMNKRTVTS